MPAVDLVDETFVVADRAVVAAVVADPARWREWWPDLGLTVFMDRRLDGIRWSVAGPWVGSCEIWLEEVGDGVLVHHYLRLDPVDARSGGPRPEPTGTAGWRRAAKERARRAKAWKRHIWALKDELEAGRRPGEPRMGTTLHVSRTSSPGAGEDEPREGPAG